MLAALLTCNSTPTILKQEEDHPVPKLLPSASVTVGRFRLGGQVLLGIENLSLAPRWAETISTTKALVTQ